MTATPLWLVQNVHLPGRKGLWQIAIEKGHFGDITPMSAPQHESYEVLNARGGLALPPFIEPHIHLDTTQTAGEPTGISRERCLRALNAGRNAKRYSAMMM
jgi:cytosine deaminase